MNPDSATLRSTDLCAILGVTNQSLYRWMARPYPLHHVGSTAPRGKTYALPEVVARLRMRRGGGLTGNGLSAVVAFDTATRAARSDDFLWLGNGAQDRAKAFLAVLNTEESERARACMKTIRNVAAENGLTGVNRLSQIAIIHPSTVRYILVNEDDEMPVGGAGWASWARAIWAVNPPETNIEKVA